MYFGKVHKADVLGITIMWPGLQLLCRGEKAAIGGAESETGCVPIKAYGD